MGPSLAEVLVSILPDFSKMGPKVKSELPKHVPDNAGDEAGKKVGTRMGGAIAAAAGTALALGVTKFIGGSVAAYKEAELAQGRLTDAFAKFPALADINRSALDKLNESLSKKTRFDDDATASGQAVLAQFGLTGQQITQLTPLLQDYAAKTGRDLPSAADALGKALLGNGRALKEVGIDFQDTGSVGSNFDQIMGGLRAQVGGFAEKEGKTAAGQSEILKNRFGELQESVGERLLPALTAIVGKLTTVVDFVGRNINVIGPLVVILGGFAAAIWAVNAANTAWTATTAALNVVLGVQEGMTIRTRIATIASSVATKAAAVATAVWTGAVWLWNAAISANPIGIVIVLIAALVAAIIVAYKNSETFRAIVQKTWEVIQAVVKFAWENVLKPILGWLIETVVDVWGHMQELARIVGFVWEAIKRVFQEGIRIVVGVFLDMVNTILQGAADAFGWVPGVGPKLRDAANQFAAFRDSVNASLAGVQDQEVSVTARLAKEGIDVSSFLGSTAGRLAAGGPVHGPGTGTSDTAGLFALSNNEHVWTAREVAAAGGHGAVAALRKGVLGLARGGPAQFNINANTAGAESAAREAATEMANVIDAGTAAILKQVLGSLGGGTVAGGYLAQMAVLRQAFPGLPLISGFRAGAFTSTGNLSYHAQGRAVDIPPRWDVFNWIAANYGKNTKELIFTPAGARQIKNGSPHVFTGGTIQRDHYDHVHWAMANGGVIREPVFGVGKSGSTYSFGERGPETVTPGSPGLVRLHPDSIRALGEYYINGRAATVQRAAMSRRV